MIRLDFAITGRYLFAAIENQSNYPSVSLKLVSLAMLHVSPSLVTASNPLVSRICIIAGDYLEENSFLYEAADIVHDSAIDLISVCMLLLVFTRCRDYNVSDMRKAINDKLLSLILAPQLPLHIAEIVRRAVDSEFPSLFNDSTVSHFATSALEMSLSSFTDVFFSDVRPSGISSRDNTDMPNSITTHNEIDNSEVDEMKYTTGTPRTPRKNSKCENSLRMISPIESLESQSALNSPWVDRQITPFTPNGSVDHDKLKSIKRGGRKPGSRRARTADEGEGEGGGSLSLAGQDNHNHNHKDKDKDNNKLWNPIALHGAAMNDTPTLQISTGDIEFMRHSAPTRLLDNITFLEPQTPMEVGVYKSDGQRENRYKTSQVRGPSVPPSIHRRRQRSNAPIPFHLESTNDIENTNHSKIDVDAPDGLYSIRPKKPLRVFDDSSLDLKDETDNQQEIVAYQGSVFGESLEYWSTKDLLPFENPQKQLKIVLEALSNEEWPSVFYTINNIRRLCYHHPSLVSTSGELHAISIAISKQVWYLL